MCMYIAYIIHMESQESRTKRWWEDKQEKAAAIKVKTSHEENKSHDHGARICVQLQDFKKKMIMTMMIMINKIRILLKIFFFARMMFSSIILSPTTPTTSATTTTYPIYISHTPTHMYETKKKRIWKKNRNRNGANRTLKKLRKH